MPLATGSQPTLASLPTFMSVFGEEASGSSSSNSNGHIKADGDATPHAPTQPLVRTLSCPEASVASTSNSSAPDLRRDSSTTLRTDSTDSSPTTTISTLDSTLTDPSPSSSPESPASHNTTLSASKTQTMKSLNAHARDLQAESPSDSSQNSSLNSSPIRPGAERSDMGSKRFRNAKNLSINTTGINTKQAASTSLGTSSLAHVAESSTSSLPAVAEPRNAPTAIPGHMQPSGQSSNAVTGHAFSAPASPSAILPSIPPPRKSRLGLTINTTESEKSDRNSVVPPTPSRIGPMALRTRGSDLSNRLGTVPEAFSPAPLSSMRETQETGEALFSPSLAPGGGMKLPPFARNFDPTLPTPGFGPAGGMQLPRAGSDSNSCSPATRTTRPALNLPRPAFDAPSSQSVIQHTIAHRPQTPQHELPLSREAKSPGYPEGPICIYPPGVFLYHQPTRDEAREFDVIINVAREVENPFNAIEETVSPAPPAAPESRYKDAGVQCTILPGEPEPSKSPEPIKEPSSAVSDKTFVSAFERQSEDEPETPKATAPSTARKADPEYIHLPWEHNSKVYDEWLRVCQLIDDRVRRGQRVLIHCQLGVSRSASLVVAYGIYKNPRLTPDEAREQAKRRSRWIDLNMHFMYELGDFRKLLAETFPEAAAAQKQQQVQQVQHQQPLHGAAARRHPGPSALIRTETDTFLMGGVSNVGDGSSEDRASPRREEGRRASTPNQTESRFDSILDAHGEVPASAPLRSSWSPTGISDEPEHAVVDSAPKKAPSPMPEPPRDDSRQNTPRAFPFRTQHPENTSASPLPPSRPAPPPPIDSTLAQAESSSPPPPRTAEKKELKPVPILPPGAIAPATTRKPSVGHVPAENLAQNTATLPPPNLSLPPAPSKNPSTITRSSSSASASSSASPKLGQAPPRRSLRPMPSLPAGFNSSIRSRRLLLHPSEPSPPPAVPPLPLHLQTPAQQQLGAGTNGIHAAAQSEEENDGLAALMSPRAAEFTASPFHCHAHRSSAGDLAVAGPAGTVKGKGRKAVEEDPRSPHAVGREPIVRSIDDVLE